MTYRNQVATGVIEKIARHLDIARYALRLSRERKQPLGPTLKRALWLYRKKRFLADEAFHLGLLRLDLDPRELDCVVSRRYQAQIQRKINPVSWSPILSDKSIFYRFCESVSLPIPSLYAIYFKKSPGYCPAGTALWDSAQWVDFIDSTLPDEFIAKPCVGFGGRGVVAFARRPDRRFASSLGPDMTAPQVLEFMRDYPGTDGFVIQERLRSHRKLVELAGTSNLQTVRIITYLDRDGRFRLLFSFFKAITEDTVADNIRDGLSRNVVNAVCLDTGTVLQSYVKTRDGTGKRPIACHPVSGKPLQGFQLPFWDKVCELVRRAAGVFLPIRAVGWDVAITDDGVRLLEGNIWWDRLVHDSRYIQLLLNDLNESSANTSDPR